MNNICPFFGSFPIDSKSFLAFIQPFNVSWNKTKKLVSVVMFLNPISMLYM